MSRLVEYVANSTAFDWDDTSIIQITMLGDSFTDFREISATVDTDGTSRRHRKLQASSSYEVSSGPATFTFTLFPAPTGQSLSASKLKIDVRITNYPWSSAGGSSSQLALLTSVEAKSKVETKEERDDRGRDDKDNTPSEDSKVHGDKGKSKRIKDEVTISFGDATDALGAHPFGDYTWETTATASSDGLVSSNDTATINSTDTDAGTTSQTIEVIASSPIVESDERSQFIAFSFMTMGHSSVIFWDPQAGVSYQVANDSTSSAPMASWVAPLLLFSASLIFM